MLRHSPKYSSQQNRFVGLTLTWPHIPRNGSGKFIRSWREAETASVKLDALVAGKSPHLAALPSKTLIDRSGPASQLVESAGGKLLNMWQTPVLVW
jgi:hypothetical protein